MYIYTYVSMYVMFYVCIYTYIYVNVIFYTSSKYVNLHIIKFKINHGYCDYQRIEDDQKLHMNSN